MTPARARVVFIGPMGAGKTRLGRRVAGMIGSPFVDTDKSIVAEHGPIADIFDQQGEPAFRAIEREHVTRALARGGVVSLGGGAVLNEDTQRDLAAEHVVLLTTRAEVVAARLDGRRPLVRENGVEAWQRIYDERRPLYERLARFTLDTSAEPFGELAVRVAHWVREQE